MSTEPLHIRVYRAMGEAGAAVRALEEGAELTEEQRAQALAWTRFSRRSMAPYAALLMARDLRDRELGDKAYDGIREALDSAGIR